MHELSAALRYQQPRLQRLLSTVQQKVQAEETGYLSWRKTTANAVCKLVSEYGILIHECHLYAQSLASLRMRWEQYGAWVTAYNSKPPKNAEKNLKLLKVEREHAEDAKELALVNEKISALEGELREYRVKWRTARDRLTECMHSGYFASLEKDETLQYMLLPERYILTLGQG